MIRYPENAEKLLTLVQILWRGGDWSLKKELPAAGFWLLATIFGVIAWDESTKSNRILVGPTGVPPAVG